MLYDESLDDYGNEVIHTIDPSTNSIHVQEGRNVYDPREGSSHMKEEHYQIIPETIMNFDEDDDRLNEDIDDDIHTVHHVNEEGHEMIGEEVEMVEMEEVMDETGQRMLVRSDGSLMYHPDDFILDDDGSTMTWRMIDEDGNAIDVGAIAPIEMVHNVQPGSFDVSAYEVCDSMSSSRNIPSRYSKGRQMMYQRRTFPPSNQRLARLDKPTSSTNPRHARISRIDESKGKVQAKNGGGLITKNGSIGSSSSLISSSNLALPPRRIPRRPTSKLSTQSNLIDATSGLETANCNYCHLRFYMPRTALRSRISYGLVDSQFELPNAFFECPICGMESASGPSSSHR
ncbi:hypothetical protein PRIPAC_94294 [Pristionchus pacificus]|uniref:Uncharacterized protein n=1 Tax=Pristionchus pacificus TaxID=54126 RepID=A0A2A6B451_PRIPA|nr:hypothetical protein PRIPAC_94294 [Pristionchus pacificus]|eukprot:PDM60656.1 hypothetical protein PRIPAC_53925 [Pristionchus pacificus]